MSLESRQYSEVCRDSNGNYYYCRNSWNSWGRWVALAIIIIFFFVVFFLFSCLTARRRRRRGLQPYRGTGWIGAAPFGHGPASYNPNVHNQNQQPVYGNQGTQGNAPPSYQQNGGYYGQNQGYFGGQQPGTELQQPPNAYRAGDDVYAPPTGPPPKKTGQ